MWWGCAYKNIRRVDTDSTSILSSTIKMYNSFDQAGNHPPRSFKNNESETSVNQCENLLNSKIFYLNNSASKFVSVGLSLRDFTPRVIIGGQKGFKIFFNENEWSQLLSNQGIISNYFYSTNTYPETQPLKISNFTIYFERTKQCPMIRIQSFEGRYIYLGKESVDKLIELEELVYYRIQLIVSQEFEKYFNTFSHLKFCQSDDFFSNVYNVISPTQNQNSENVSTMMELLIQHPKELENKVKNGVSLKRKYYDEIGDY